ncbi:hypothetical protein HY643_04095 [Candidatus Woesearchaeota archaeon]|nr:hypothetical protein [Candidatus Woesearchaeota archaeon]
MVYIKGLYKMAEIFETTIICDNCKKPTERKIIQKDGFNIRSWHCPTCHKYWHHPLDLQEYKSFQQLKERTYQLKIRQVGNSWTVSIPKEIIAFEEIETRINKMIKMSLEEPGKLTIFFSRKIQKNY